MEWMSASEIAAARLPDMPATRQGVLSLAARLCWADDRTRCRRRKGRGGGLEFHQSLFPARAQAQLARAAANAPARGAAHDIEAERSERWRALAALPRAAREKAERKLAAIQAVETLEAVGESRSRAVQMAAPHHGCSERTLWSWLTSVDGVPRQDRLAWLVPQHRLAERTVETAEIAAEAWDRFKAFYLTPERRTVAHCYDMVADLAGRHGWAWPSRKTIERRIRAEIPRQTLVLARDGVEALKALSPAQIRDRNTLHALECVNADAHKIDVRVMMPDGRVIRPMLVAFGDVYSGRLLSYRIDESENAWAVMGAFSDMINAFGVPYHVVLDNGRGFASKQITGGIANRFRFKVLDSDPLGVIPRLGCQVHWTIPYNGRAKPIERTFRDLADRLAKDPRFAGAYVGKSPVDKPGYERGKAGSVPFALFEEVVAEGIAAHNTRPGRRGQTHHGRSLAETFDESYATAPIRMPLEEAKRLCLMGATGITARAPDGRIVFQGNAYWSDWCPTIAGKRVTVRFDPADLHAGLHIEDSSGRGLGHAACIDKVGFLDVEGAQTHARANRARLRAERDRLAAINTMLAAEAAADLAPAREDRPPSPTVIRPVRPSRGRTAAAVARDVADQDQVWATYLAGHAARLRLVEDD
jgi:hypothetical protein